MPPPHGVLSAALEPSPHNPVVGRLAAVQHALFAILVLVALVRAMLHGASAWLAPAGALLLLACYAAGIALRARWSMGGSVWLGGLTGCWLLLVLVWPDFVWVAFSMWLLVGHVLRLRWAALYTTAVVAVVIWVQAARLGSISTSEVLGPIIGALFAIVISQTQHQLIRDDAERRGLVASLVHAQHETELLQDELAATQRQAGIMAERTRLSRDIHDTLAQGFSSILLLARAGSRADGTPRLRTLLHQIELASAAGLDDARRVVGALAPEDLETSGLAAAIARLLEAVETDTGIHAELSVEGDLRHLPRTAEVALLRTAQGALANVRQHSGASRVVATLTHTGGAARLDVVDDGRGFDTALWRSVTPASFEHGGYGLRSTRARLRELGGDLVVESAPGEGTALSAHLPITMPSAAGP